MTRGMSERRIIGRRISIGLVLLGCVPNLLGLAGCADVDRDVSAEEVERAQAVVGSFKQELQAALRDGLAEGPENAIQICQVQAPEIGERLSRGGIVVGRTSHRLRNPGNAPRPWMEPLLGDYATGREERSWRAVRLEGGSVGYVEPIYVQPLCLKCHGADLDEPVAGRIQALYPNDEATGFEPGDFRGLFWVTMDERAKGK